MRTRLGAKLVQEHDAAPRQGRRLPWAWFVVAAVVVIAFYPGVMSNDSFASLKQARSFEFTTWHPPIMAFIWSFLDRVVEGPALMLVAQAVLYATAAARLCVEAFPRIMQRVPRWLVVPAFALFPPAMALNGMIWKDVWMSAFLLFALAFLFRLARVEDPRGRRRAFCWLLLSCLLATAFRHNAVAATAGLLAGGFFFLVREWRLMARLLASCTAGVALAVALALLVSMATRLVASPAHVTTPILLHDIAGMVVRSGEPWAAARYALSVAPQLSDQDRRTFVRRIKRTYHPAAAGRVLRTSRRPDAPFAVNVYDPAHDAAAVRLAWTRMLERYPTAYLGHRTGAFRCLLQLCDMAVWKDHSYVLNPRYVSAAAVPAPQSWLRSSLLNPSLARAYSPAFWLAVALVGGLVGLFRLRSPHSILLFMGLSAAGLSLSLFFTSPIDSYRYMHWVILVGWIVLWLGCEEVVRKREAA